jgi:hypothetical protein
MRRLSNTGLPRHFKEFISPDSERLGHRFLRIYAEKHDRRQRLELPEV